jgi:hypothetical protein
MADGEREVQHGWIPDPDPSVITTEVINAVKADFRRELAGLRELIEARIVMTEGIAGRSSEALHIEINRRLEALDVRNAAIREEITSEIHHLELLQDERFKAIAERFTERDFRSDQDKRTSKEALDAALLAAKESVLQQNDANTTAAAKSETSFTNQIDQIGVLMATLEKALTDRITELKERIDRGEGGASGSRQTGADIRANIAIAVSVLAIIASVVIYAALHSP